MVAVVPLTLIHGLSARHGVEVRATPEKVGTAAWHTNLLQSYFPPSVSNSFGALTPERQNSAL